MKKIFLLLVIVSHICDAQTFNYNTNAYEQNNEIRDSAILPPAAFFNTSLAGIPCNPNSFWAIANNYILEFQLNGSTITFIDTVLYVPGKTSLAFADLAAVSMFSPTFYSSEQPYNDIRYFDSLSWQSAYTSTGYTLFNCGGSANNLFYQALPVSGHRKIFRYNGTGIDTIFSGSSNHIVSLADVAADIAGNVYFPVGTSTTTPDSIIVLDTAGNVLNEFPFSLSTDNGYGCFIMNNTFYLGLGGGHPLYPGTLLPITFSGNMAIQGTPIPFPGSSYFLDLESCNQGLPLGISSVNVPGTEIYIANPVKDICTIRSGKEKIKTISLYDASGKELKAIEVNNTSAQINVSGFANGFYILSIRFSSSAINRKLEIRND